MHHECFDPAWFRKELSPADARDLWLFGDSPICILSMDYHRARVIESTAPGPDIKTDRFIFAWGEPPCRQATKVSGLPYRLQDRPWPQDVLGNPMVFLAQFCFADSCDIIPELPGDVLLVFVREFKSPLFDIVVPYVLKEEDPHCLYFEWASLGLPESQLAAYVPPTGLVLPVCHGWRYRTEDFPGESTFTEISSRILPRDLLPDRDHYRTWMLRALACHCGMKIGGTPFWYSSPDTTAPGRFLASFHGVRPVSEIPFPWANCRIPLSDAEALQDENSLNLLFDSGILNLFLQEDGSIEWHLDSPAC